MMEKIFNRIYNENTWNDPFSRSGTGSNLLQTQKIRTVVPAIVERYRIKTFLDIPCGDFFWMKEIQPVLDKTLDRYVGGDIVEELVKINNREHANAKFTFEVVDVQHSSIPKVDIVFCRDCFVHFSYKDILIAIKNIKKSRSTYLLTTTFPARKNRNILTGTWFPINLQRFPFYFPQPLEIIEEDCTEFDGAYRDKAIALWEIEKISIPKFSTAVFLFSFLSRLYSLARREK